MFAPFALKAGPKVMRRSWVRVLLALPSGSDPFPVDRRTNFQVGVTLPLEMTMNLIWYDK